MLVKYLQDCPIAYDGIHIIREKKGNKKNVDNAIANRLILAGKAEVFKNMPEQKKVKEYEDKQVKDYENKASVKRGRPKKEVK
jgi:hypothetical protein